MGTQERADRAPRLERDTRAPVLRCCERPIYTPAGVQPATKDLLHAVMTWLGRYARPAPRGVTVSHAASDEALSAGAASDSGQTWALEFTKKSDSEGSVRTRTRAVRPVADPATGIPHLQPAGSRGDRPAGRAEGSSPRDARTCFLVFPSARRRDPAPYST